MGTFAIEAGKQAAGAAGSIIGTGLGMATAGWEDKRQLKQAGKLQALEMQGAQQMGKFNQGLALDMWNKTNYSAQREQMEKAGLNVGLMYEGGGPGGTTQTPTGNVGREHASGSSGNATGMGMQMGLQMAMMQSQIEVAKSQAKKNDAEADAIGGYKKTESGAAAENLAANTELTKLKKSYQEFDNKMKELATNRAKDFDQDERLKMTNDYNRIAAETQQELNKAEISDATKEKEIQLLNNRWLQQNADIAVAEADRKLKGDQAAVAKKAIEEASARMNKMISDTGVAWYELDVKQKQLKINEALKDLVEQRTNFETGTMAEIKRGMGIVGDAAVAAKGYKKQPGQKGGEQTNTYDGGR